MKRLAGALVTLGVAGLAAWWLLSPGVDKPGSAVPSANVRPPMTSPSPAAPDVPVPGPTPAPTVAAPLAPAPNPPGLPPALDEPSETAPAGAAGLAPLPRVERLRATIRQYGMAFNGNPVGTNAEITAALNGDNPRHAFFLDGADGHTINAGGELTDPWGSPYFFHQLSSTEMEVRSAGPDRRMYTDDDLVVH